VWLSMLIMLTKEWTPLTGVCGERRLWLSGLNNYNLELMSSNEIHDMCCGFQMVPANVSVEVCVLFLCMCRHVTRTIWEHVVNHRLRAQLGIENNTASLVHLHHFFVVRCYRTNVFLFCDHKNNIFTQMRYIIPLF